MLARITIADQFLGPRVEVLLTDLDALSERRSRRLVQDSHTASRAGGHFQAVEPGASFGCAHASCPDLPWRQGVALDRLVAMQFWCRDKLLHAFDAHSEAEVRVPELALETPLLLF